MPRPEQQDRSGEDHRSRAQVPQQVIRQQRNVVPDLMQLHELVLDGAVVELKRSGSQQDGSRPPCGQQDGPAPKISEKEQSGHHGKPSESVEKPIREEPGGGGGLVIEMVPLQQLVKDNLVHKRGNAYADQHSGKDVAA